MSNELELSYVEKHFGHCVIKWFIKDFSLLLCNESLTFESPEISVRGPFVTRWKLSLNIKSKIDDNEFISIRLQKLEANGDPKLFGFNCKVYLTIDNDKKQYGEVEFMYNFGNSSEWTEDMEKLSYILDKFTPLNIDVLCVRCHLLVTFCDSVKVGKPTDFVQASLSNDLRALYKTSKFSDLVLKLGDKELRVHKAILHSRNEQFSTCIRENRGNLVVPVDENQLDFASMEKVIAYLYTGNLEHVLNEPSLSIQECSVYLNIDELNAFYVPDEVDISTSIDKEEMVFTWVIDSVSKIEKNCLLSPRLTLSISDTVWRLRLYPKGIGNDVEYMSIFAEVVEGMKRMDVCLDFGIISNTTEPFFQRRVHKCMEIGEQVVGISDFIRRDALEKSKIIIKDQLDIVFKIRISKGNLQSKICNLVSVVTPSMGKNESYETLMSSISSLLNTDKYKDLVLKAEDETFSVHKCLLAARSRGLSVLASKLKAGETLDISYVKPNILRIVIQFIYSNKLDDLPINVRLEVYEAARKLIIPALTGACMEYLMNNLRVDNVCDILIFAHHKNDALLIRKSLNAIAGAPSHFFEADLSPLREVNQSLYNEVRQIYQRVGFY